MNRVGSYEALRVAGVGGSGTVHEGRSREGRVALKRLHGSEDASSLLEEARVLARIDHPNVVRVLDIVETAAPTLVLEWIDGSTLASLLARGPLALDVAVAIVSDVLAGLEATHEADIVHCDVCPQNILVGRDGVARISDFGSAKTRASRPLSTIDGKLGYMAPEQLEGRCDRRTDVYGVGVVLWEMLTGRAMRTPGGSAAETLVAILHGLALPPSRFAPTSPAVEDLVMRALSRFPAGRFTTAREMAGALVGIVTPASRARVAAAVTGEAHAEPRPSTLVPRRQVGALRGWSASARAPRSASRSPAPRPRRIPISVPRAGRGRARWRRMARHAPLHP